MSRGDQLQRLQRREASVLSHLLKLCVPLALALLSMRVALEISTCGALYRVAPSVRSMRDSLIVRMSLIAWYADELIGS